MLKYIYRIYSYLFATPYLFNLNKLFFNLSLRGLGILNWETKYLSGELDWLKKYLSESESPVILDVGANVGNYSHEILKAFPNATVYAIEPHPKNFIKLRNLAQNNLYCFNNAIGDNVGQLQLYDYESNDGSTHASLYMGAIEELRGSKSVSHIVDVITLDVFCTENNIQKIDFLKIDTEGNELKCLIGAKQLLLDGKINAIQFEFNEMNLFSRNTFKDFWDLLVEDFSLYRLLPGGKLLPIKAYSPIHCEIYAYQNIIGLKRF